MRRREGVAQALAAAAALVLGTMTPPASQAQTAPSSPPNGPANQVASVTLARGVKPASLFGSGDVTPVEPATAFISTDLPYAIVKVKALVPDTTVTLRLVNPAGTGYSVDAKTPQHKNNEPWKEFDFAAPLYILGTDLEGQTGAWHLQILVGGQVQYDTAFQWQPATLLALSKIKDAVDQTPRNADLHWRYGAALAQLGHDPEAIQELQHAIQLDSKYALFHITLGRIYEREGRPADAVREFQAALGLHGSFYDAVFSSWAQAHLNHLQTR